MRDVLIIGGGPAGLSAALILGRARKSVILFDHSRYRNATSHAVHGFLTRDGSHPMDLLRISRDQLKRYGTVEPRDGEVTKLERLEDGSFRATLATGESVVAKKALLATGLADTIPPIPGLREQWGIGVHHCPFCDGWEYGDKTIGVLGDGSKDVESAVFLTGWSSKVILFSNGTGREKLPRTEILDAFAVQVDERSIRALEGEREKRLSGVRMADESLVEIDALFLQPPCAPTAALAEQVGCNLDEGGSISVNDYEATNVPGLYAAGDVTKDFLLAIVAASEGARAGVAITKALLKDEIRERLGRKS